MGALGISNGVLNQKGSPAIYTDTFANRPAAGFNGRLFVSTDTSQIFEDNGSSWVLIANSGIGSTGTLQVVTTNGNTTNTGISITAGGLTTNAAKISGLTQDGGVLFTDATGNMLQDVNFTWDATNNYLGIGPTGAPSAPLDIHNGTLGVQVQINATSTNNSAIAFQNASVGKWRVGNLYSAGANLFHIYNNAAAGNALTITSANVATFTGAVTAASLAIAGGTSSQFLKANGTTDSTQYISLTSLSATSPLVYNNGTGAFTILQSSSTQSGYLSSTDWSTFNSKASLGSFSATSPLAYNSGTGAFTIQVANSGQSGYLTSTDWNTFNNKQSALTFGNLTESTSSVLTITGGTGAVIGSGTTIQIKQSSATQSGYLSSTDWTTFNSKQSQINGTGFVKATGTTISYDNSTYYLASNPSNYITLASLSGTTPISYNTGTGAISIAQSNSTTSGYLSSTDWNTFNSKASLTAFSASPPLSYNSGTGAFSISQASGSTNGYLSSTDWTTFNNKQNALTNPVTGTGTINYIPKFTATGTTIGNSIMLQGTNNTISSVFSSATGSQYFAGMFTGQGASGYTGSMYFGAGEPNGADPSFPNVRAGLKVYQSWNGSSTDVKFDLFTLQGGVGNNTVLTGNANGTATFFNTITQTSLTSNFVLNRTGGVSYGAGLQYQTSGTNNWIVGTGQTTTGTDYQIYNYTQGGALNITYGTNNIQINSTTDAGYRLDVNGTGRFSGALTATGAITTNANFINSQPVYSTTGNVGNLLFTNTYPTTSNVAQIASVLDGFYYASKLVFRTADQYNANLLVDRLTIASTGAATFSSTLGINGVSDNIKSGTYTPTLTAITNISALTAFTCQYMRVGNVVTVSGKVYGSPTAISTETAFRMTVPINSAMTAVEQAGGTGRSSNGSTGDGFVAFVNAYGTNEVRFSYWTPAIIGTGGNFWFSFTYLIV